MGRGEALLATLLFPAASPVIVSAVKCTTALLEGKALAAVQQWMLLIVGFDAVFLFLALLTFEFVLED